MDWIVVYINFCVWITSYLYSWLSDFIEHDVRDFPMYVSTSLCWSLECEDIQSIFVSNSSSNGLLQVVSGADWVTGAESFCFMNDLNMHLSQMLISRFREYPFLLAEIWNVVFIYYSKTSNYLFMNNWVHWASDLNSFLWNKLYGGLASSVSLASLHQGDPREKEGHHCRIRGI